MLSIEIIQKSLLSLRRYQLKEKIERVLVLEDLRNKMLKMVDNLLKLRIVIYLMIEINTNKQEEKPLVSLFKF